MNMQTAAHYCSINLISPRRDALAFNLKRSKQSVSRRSIGVLFVFETNRRSRLRLLFNSAEHIVCKFWQNGARTLFKIHAPRAGIECTPRTQYTAAWSRFRRVVLSMCVGPGAAAPTFYLFIIVGINGLLN
jgi:hypothetical protein